MEVRSEEKERTYKKAGIKGYIKKTAALLTAGAILLTAVPMTAEAASWKRNNVGWWWQEDDGSYPANTWKTINGKVYAFDSRGYMRHGWYLDGGNWYYLGTDGAVKTGWQRVGGKWYFLNADGKMATGWKTVNGKKYFLEKSGAMHYGWLKDGGYWYYMGSANDGAMKSGWQQVGGRYYYMYADGKMAANVWVDKYYVNGSGVWTSTKQQAKWIKSGGRWWYRHSDGSYTKNGWEDIGGKRYLFDKSGWMLTGWQKVGGTWYYLQPGGAMLGQGWHWIGGKCYYMYDSGAMASNTWIGNYYVDGSGAWVQDADKHEHNYTEINTKQPTCTEEGQKTLMCKTCGSIKTELILAFTHNWEHHEAIGHEEEYVVEDEWDQPIYESHYVCGTCGMDFGCEPDADVDAVRHIMDSDFYTGCQNYSYRPVKIRTEHHDAVIDIIWVEDQPAYDRCITCGAVR